MPTIRRLLLTGALPLLVCAPARGGNPLDLGAAFHAFDHLGAIGDQAPAAAASGGTVIYAYGLGSLGYDGLPAPDKLDEAARAFAAYVRDARHRGIRLVFGYVCATSLVKPDTFDREWPPAFRAQFSSPVGAWLQQDDTGRPLASWYGGDYRPACMSNPDWQAYERYMARRQLEAGADGIFFDNPTVHAQGCYCGHCLGKFAAFLRDQGVNLEVPATAAVDFLRREALGRPEDFARFRGTVARDFFAEMRAFARTIKPDALITGNNSLNSPGVFFTQCRSLGYNLHEMSKAQDLVILEDMTSQPRTTDDGRTLEYGPVYEAVQAIVHGKPLVAVTLADGDYHTPARLVRLAMAEAAAHGASYLSWPTWPEPVRASMAAAIRPQADLLRRNADLLHGARPAADVVVFLPFRLWTQTPDCRALAVADALGRANVQFKVVCEDDLPGELAAFSGVLVIESPSVLIDRERKAVDVFTARGGRVICGENPGWLADVKTAVKNPRLVLNAPASVRAVVRETTGAWIVHLLNLNIERLSSFADRVTPAERLHLRLRLPPGAVKSVRAVTADAEAATPKIEWTATADAAGVTVEVTVPRLFISTMLVVE